MHFFSIYRVLCVICNPLLVKTAELFHVVEQNRLIDSGHDELREGKDLFPPSVPNTNLSNLSQKETVKSIISSHIYMQTCSSVMLSMTLFCAGIVEPHSCPTLD